MREFPQAIKFNFKLTPEDIFKLIHVNIFKLTPEDIFKLTYGDILKYIIKIINIIKFSWPNF